jgi:hypothetical protein
MSVIISKTARQTGFGTDMFKRVVHLTKTERAAVRKGKLVVFDLGRKSGGSHGTSWRVCKYVAGYGIAPRVPTAEQLLIIEQENESLQDFAAWCDRLGTIEF